VLVDLAPIHRAIQPLGSPPALPSAALSALERRTRELHRPGDSVAICVRRDLMPGQILVGLTFGDSHVAVTVHAREKATMSNRLGCSRGYGRKPGRCPCLTRVSSGRGLRRNRRCRPCSRCAVAAAERAS
jgi:hypothetical protein